jgi:hypothetical protein
MKIYKNGHKLFLQLSFEPAPILDDSEVKITVTKKSSTQGTATLQHQEKGAVVEIPVPPIVPVTDYKHEVPADFIQPSSFIRYRATKENNGEIAGFADLKTAPPVELNLTLQDMNWLRTHHKYGENGDPRFRISEKLLERMLYLLELNCGTRDRIISVKEAEDILSKN